MPPPAACHQASPGARGSAGRLGPATASGARLELLPGDPHTDCPPERSTPMALFRKKSAIPSREEALPGRTSPLKVPETHFVNGHRIVPPFPAGTKEAV